MTITSAQFDVTKFDSGKVDLNAPNSLAASLLAASQGLTEAPPIADGPEKIRMRLIADTVVATNLVRHCEISDWASTIHEITTGKGGQLHSLPAGLHFLQVENWVTIMLPDVASLEEADKIASSINQVHDLFEHALHWVLDMGQLSKYPASLLGYIVGLNQGLKSRHKDLVLLWLRRESIPDRTAASLKTQFHLVKKGAFYLSRI